VIPHKRQDVVHFFADGIAFTLLAKLKARE
jgi:hypothetical protein